MRSPARAIIARTLWRLAAATTSVAFWVDGGFTDLTAAEPLLRPGIVPVFGSETLAAPPRSRRFSPRSAPTAYVLSLDYRGGALLGGPEVERRVELWPSRLILMTLDRVGTGGGPDIAALRRLRERAAPRAVFAAGGVRARPISSRWRSPASPALSSRRRCMTDDFPPRRWRGAARRRGAGSIAQRRQLGGEQ